MEIFVLKNAPLTFTNDGMQTSTKLCTFKKFIAPKPDIQPVSGSYTKEKVMEKLYEMLYIQPESTTRILGYARKKFDIFAAVRSLDVEPPSMEIIWASKTIDSFFLQLLSLKKFAVDIKLNVKLTQGKTEFKLTHREPMPTKCKWFAHDGTIGISMFLENIPSEIVTGWNVANSNLSGIFDLSVILNKDIIDFFYGQSQPILKSREALLRKMIASDTYPDMCIVPSGEGQPVNCHRAMIVPRSPLFRNLIQNLSENSSTTFVKLEMGDVNENEARALVNFLYKSDVTAALSDINFCFKLLKIGYSYKIFDLMSIMRELIMIRGNEEIGVDLAVEIILFVKEVSCADSLLNTECTSFLDEATRQEAVKSVVKICNDLTLKSVQVLKWYAREKPMEFETSENYKTLCMNTPEIAMELDSKLLQFVDTDAYSLYEE